MGHNKLVVLETQVILLHVGAIDIRHGVFQAELEIIAKWIPPSEEGTHRKENFISKKNTYDGTIVSEPKVLSEDFTNDETKRENAVNTENNLLENIWTPHFNVKNMMGHLVTVHKKVTMDPIREGFVSQDLVVWGEFLFDPETLYFPFDTQSLKLIFYCSNSDGRQVLIINSLRLMHFVKQEYNMHFQSFVLYDVIDSVTTSDQDFYRKNFSVLIITFYVAKKLSFNKVKLFILPYLLTGMATLNLYTDNVFLHERIFIYLMIIIFVFITHSFCSLPLYQFAIMDILFIVFKVFVVISIGWLFLQSYGWFVWGKIILTVIYLIYLVLLSYFLYNGVWLLKARMVTNSLLYRGNLDLVSFENSNVPDRYFTSKFSSVYPSGAGKLSLGEKERVSIIPKSPKQSLGSKNRKPIPFFIDSIRNDKLKTS